MVTALSFSSARTDPRLGQRLLLAYGALGYRAMITPVSVAPLLFDVTLSWSLPIVGVCLAIAGGNVWAMTRVSTWLAVSRLRLGAMLAADAVTVVAANLLLGVAIQQAGGHSFGFPLWPLVQGLVLLFAALAGMRAAGGVVLVGAPLAVVMCRAYGIPSSEAAPIVVTHVLWLAVAWTAVYLARQLFHSQEEVAEWRGAREGREAERVRGRRLMHDTALQSLEAIALLASNPAIDDRAGRELVARAARGEITTVRRILAAGSPDGLHAEVARVVDEARLRGLAVDLSFIGDDDTSVDPSVLDACCGAIREALSNVYRHADACRTAVRVDVTSSTVSVEVEDDGVGFDCRTVSLGFGIPDSIEARLRVVGGSAHIRSVAGRGTTVSVVAPLLVRSGRMTGAGLGGVRRVCDPLLDLGRSPAARRHVSGPRMASGGAPATAPPGPHGEPPEHHENGTEENRHRAQDRRRVVTRGSGRR
jgi:signal transduction histidine kinase